MITALRLFGSTASSIANLFLFGTIAALWPRVGECPYASCQGDLPPFVAFDTWRPFIDNPGSRKARGNSEPECPAPRGGEFRTLAEAPLPVDYDPHAYAGRALYACVLAGSGGEVLDARILNGTSRAALDRAILEAVLRDWRFGPDSWGGATWQRVRLNPGPVDGRVREETLLLF